MATTCIPLPTPSTPIMIAFILCEFIIYKLSPLPHKTFVIFTVVFPGSYKLALSIMST